MLHNLSNSETSNHRTLLYYAIVFGYKNEDGFNWVLYKFLECGADPNKRDTFYGMTVLMHLASENRVNEMGGLFYACEKRGIKIEIDALDCHGHSALWHARQNKCGNAERFLLERRAEDPLVIETRDLFDGMDIC